MPDHSRESVLCTYRHFEQLLRLKSAKLSDPWVHTDEVKAALMFTGPSPKFHGARDDLGELTF
jgi:hypothetical protein